MVILKSYLQLEVGLEEISVGKEIELIQNLMLTMKTYPLLPKNPSNLGSGFR